MRPFETYRFACDGCDVAYTLTVTKKGVDAAYCPFCGGADCKPDSTVSDAAKRGFAEVTGDKAA